MKKEGRPIKSSQNTPTPRQIYFREMKEQTLRELGLEINEKNMKKVTVDTGWERG